MASYSYSHPKDYLTFDDRSLYDGDLHDPFIAAGPGIPEGKVSPGLGLNVDSAPTILSLAELPATRTARTASGRSTPPNALSVHLPTGDAGVDLLEHRYPSCPVRRRLLWRRNYSHGMNGGGLSHTRNGLNHIGTNRITSSLTPREFRESYAWFSFLHSGILRRSCALSTALNIKLLSSTLELEPARRLAW